MAEIRAVQDGAAHPPQEQALVRDVFVRVVSLAFTEDDLLTLHV